MAAPSGIVWGDIKNNYCRIGIYVGLSNTDTKTTASIEVWFWSKYSVYDVNNRWYFANDATSKSLLDASYTDQGVFNLYTTNDSGDGWSTENQVKLGTLTYTYDRGASNAKRYLVAQFSAVGMANGNMYATTSFTIPALNTYTVSYDANGGTGAPSAQTKAYDVNLLLSDTIPTRTGYSFNNWLSTTQNQTYRPATYYGHNASTTMKAQWTANTYTVSYNANGGSGAPGSQTKTHGTALTLSSTAPTRSGYNFLGWGTSASSTTVAYAAGASYTTNANITLYAIWGLAYTKPRITGLSVSRCNSDGVAAESGTYALVKFSWACDKAVSSIKIAWDSNVGSGSETVSASGTSGNVSTVVGGSIVADELYTITATVADSGGSSSQSSTLGGAAYTLDLLAGGKGIAFGKPATREGFDCGFTIYDKFGALIGNGLAAYTGGGDSGIDPNTTLEELCLTSHSNAPQGLGTFYYIHTAFYNTKSASAARMQVAIPYNKHGSAYHRYYSSGDWSSWARYMTADEVYPVGSIVLRYDTVSPADLYGGTWVRIEGRMPFGCASSGTVGATGTHTTGSGSSSLPYVNVAMWRRTA